MNKSAGNFILGLVLTVMLASPSVASAAAWTVTGFVGGPPSGQDTGVRNVGLTVADENGVPVQKLKSTNFSLKYFACGAHNCTVYPATIKADENSEVENDPGNYVLTVHLDPRSYIASKYIVDVYRRLMPGEIGAAGGKTVIERHKAHVAIGQ